MQTFRHLIFVSHRTIPNAAKSYCGPCLGRGDTDMSQHGIVCRQRQQQQHSVAARQEQQGVLPKCTLVSMVAVSVTEANTHACPARTEPMCCLLSSPFEDPSILVGRTDVNRLPLLTHSYTEGVLG